MELPLDAGQGAGLLELAVQARAAGRVLVQAGVDVRGQQEAVAFAVFGRDEQVPSSVPALVQALQAPRADLAAAQEIEGLRLDPVTGPHAQGVRDGPRVVVVVALAESRLVAAEPLRPGAIDPDEELRLGSTLEMLGRHQIEVGGQQLPVEVVDQCAHPRREFDRSLVLGLIDIQTQPGAAVELEHLGALGKAVDQLGDLTFVELPAIGTTVTRDERFGEVESTKTVSDLYASVTRAFDVMDCLIERTDEFGNTVGYEYDPAGNLVARGYGEEQPITGNETASDKAQNRRVELSRL